MPLSTEQHEYLAAARSQLSAQELEELLAEMVGIPSPTGEEGTLAQTLVDRLEETGIAAAYQPIDGAQGNAIGRIAGAGTGASLLLYGHLDTHLSGSPQEDAPAFRGRVPATSRPHACRDGDHVVGLGAGNPKGYSACMVAAAIALARAEIPLSGDLMLGLAAGGMPANPPASSTRRNIGHGVGCTYLLQQGTRPDFAVIGKPGHAVAWEEVGLCWFRIRVEGEFGYAGTRHILAYKNPIADAAHVILELEPWLEEYARQNGSELLAPQGIIGATSAGWPHKPSFVPAWTDLFLDVRVSPHSDPLDVKRQLGRALEEIVRRHPGITAQLEMTLAIPGSRTDRDSWIVRSCIRAFEATEERRHQPIGATSGATDAAILRMWGIPTARLGMASPQRDRPPSLELDLNTIHLPSMIRYVETLLHVVIDTCCRDRSELLSASAARR